MKLFYAKCDADSTAIAVMCDEYKKRGAYFVGASGVKIHEKNVGVANMGAAFAETEDEAVELVKKWFAESAEYHANIAKQNKKIAKGKVKKMYEKETRK